MTNYPITDPAEIAKLPDGVYRAVNSAELYHFKGQFNYLDDLCNSWVYAKEIAEAGGIACRLVDPAPTISAIRDLRDKFLHDLSTPVESEWGDGWDGAIKEYLPTLNAILEPWGEGR